tara:strand:+ start:595 stop:777 length:183 start_codon:yes stop_codon:yes gene_type:complete
MTISILERSIANNKAGTSSKSFSLIDAPEFRADTRSCNLPVFTAVTRAPSLNGLSLKPPY